MSNSDYTDWYNEAYGAVISKINSPKSHVEYFKENKEALGLTKATSSVSIGPGNGLLEAQLLGECMPCLQSYVAIDADAKALAEFQARVQHLENRVKIQLIHEDAHVWSGPEQTVDLILLCHVLYHIDPDSRVAFLRRCVTWLNPGGRIIIAIRESAFEFAEKFSSCKNNYIASNTRQELEQIGIRGIYKEDQLSTQIDFRNRSHVMMKFFWGKNATDEECKAMDASICEVLPESQIYEFTSTIFTLRKEDFIL